MQLTTTHPARVAERIAALDLVSRTAASSSAWARAPASPSWSRSASTSTRSARSGRRRSSAIIPMFTQDGGRASRQVFRHAAAQRRAEAAAEAAPAACGSPARRWRRSRWPGGAASARWPSSSCRPTRRMPGCTPITTPSPSASEKLADYVTNPNLAIDQLFHVRRDRRGGAPPRRRHPVLPVRAALLRPEREPRAAGPRARSICGTNTRSGSAPTPRALRARLSRRADRLARDPAREIAQVRDLAYRPGHPA